MRWATRETRLTDSAKEMAGSHLHLIDIAVSMSRKNSGLKFAIATLGEPEYRQVASLALCRAAGRYDSEKSTFPTYALCTMIPTITDAAKRFVRYRDGKRSSYKNIPTIDAAEFVGQGTRGGKPGWDFIILNPVQPVFKPLLSDDELSILRWACDVIPGTPGEVLRQTFLEERLLKDVGVQFRLSAQNAWHSRQIALDALRLLVEYSPEGGLVRVPRLDCSAGVGARLVAAAIEERHWRPASWLRLLEETELTPESLDAALAHGGWFSTRTDGLYWVNKPGKEAFRLATGRAAQPEKRKHRKKVELWEACRGEGE